MGKFSAFLPLRGRIAEDSDPYTVSRNPGKSVVGRFRGVEGAAPYELQFNELS